MCSGGTIFPEGLGLGSTWNLALFDAVYAAAAREARAIGVHQIFTLVVEPNRDPRLGRNQEGYSEDPWLVLPDRGDDRARGAGRRRVAARQGGGRPVPLSRARASPRAASSAGPWRSRSGCCARCSCRPGWRASAERAPSASWRPTPRSTACPSTLGEDPDPDPARRAGLRGPRPERGGRHLDAALRGPGADQKEAGALALAPGWTWASRTRTAYMGALVENVRSGVVPEALVDRAVRRILRQKMRLGLFERPLVDPDRAAAVVHAPEHRELALRAAREGIVLLKNERDLLPLRKDLGAIAVIGPNADDPRNQLGDYTAQVVLQDVVTVLEGVRAKVAPADARALREGCDVIGNATDEIAAAVEAAREGGGRRRRPRRERVARAGEDGHERRGLRRGEPGPDRPAGGAAEGRPRDGHADRPRAGERPAALDPLGRRARPGDRRGVAARRAGRRGGGRRALRRPRARGPAADHDPAPRRASCPSPTTTSRRRPTGSGTAGGSPTRT